MPSVSRRTSTDRRERGAILVLTGITLTALLAFAAIAVDLGYQRVARRDMQAIADVIALDLVRMVDGRTVSAIELDTAWDAGLAASIARNGDTQGDDLDVIAELGLVDSSTNEFTLWDEVDGDPDDLDDASTVTPNAVRVTASASTARFFSPTDDGHVSRSAVAGGGTEQACFMVGSYALELSSQKSALLNALLNDALDLGVISYEGLATADITLEELLGAYVDLNLGTADELLTSEVALQDFYVAIAEVLRRQGDTANANLLQNTIAANVGALPPIHLADIIAIDPTDEAALAATLNVLDLVAGAAFVANGENLLAIPNISTDLGFLQLGASATIIERPRKACGEPGPDTRAETSQIHIEAGDPDLININLPIPLVGSVSIVGGLTLELDNAQGIGTLADVVCGAEADGMDINVSSALLHAGVDIPIRVRGDVRLIGLLQIVTVDIIATLHIGTTPPPTTALIQFRFPPDNYNEFKPANAASVGLSGLAVQTRDLRVDAKLLGLIPISLDATQLGQVLDPIIGNVVNPLIQTLDDALLGPISQLLGLNVAGADVAAVPPEVRCVGDLALVG